MTLLSYEVLPGNRRTVDPHISEIWRLVTVFVQSIKREEGAEVFIKYQEIMGGKDETTELMPRFESYVAAEEKRLLRNLEDINYRIDGLDALRVISGEGRAETVGEAVRDASPRTILTGTRV